MLPVIECQLDCRYSACGRRSIGEKWPLASFVVPCWTTHHSGKARSFYQFVGAQSSPCAGQYRQ